MEGLPIIKVDIMVDRWKARIAEFLNEQELESYIKKSAFKALDNFDFDSYIEPIVHETIEKEIKSYFSYGKGRNMIEKAVKEAFEESGDE